MAAKSNADWKKDNRGSLKKFQLPNAFKKIGLIIFILSFISMFVVSFTIESGDKDGIFRLISKFGILFGLLLISISKEKIEDELVIQLRMQSYTIAFIIGVIYALALPIVDYLFDILFSNSKEIKGVGDFNILWMLLSVQVAYYEMLKRAHK